MEVKKNHTGVELIISRYRSIGQVHRELQRQKQIFMPDTIVEAEFFIERTDV